MEFTFISSRRFFCDLIRTFVWPFFCFGYDAIEARDCDTAPLAGGARQALELGAGEAAPLPLWLLLLKCHKNWAKHVDISVCVSLGALF